MSLLLAARELEEGCGFDGDIPPSLRLWGVLQWSVTRAVARLVCVLVLRVYHMHILGSAGDALQRLHPDTTRASNHTTQKEVK